MFARAFGVEKDKGLASALGAVMQTVGGEDLCPSLEVECDDVAAPPN
jgi:hypothetical protein